ncbi:hypothetical protein RJ639_004989 [Escallonia herrerae]|uniref:HMA domain-containing protein n=1 Tax=Escallonia herrerae TaxID=1293975 RepID=A0AA89AW32_9ASTE|nr:hypothetical protein RJ639_004989 [Escallonia herrerae]
MPKASTTKKINYYEGDQRKEGKVWGYYTLEVKHLCQATYGTTASRLCVKNRTSSDMALVSWAKKELTRLTTHRPKRLLPAPTSLDSGKCLQMPLVQEVVLAADLKCAKCQMRVANVISEMDGMESIVVHVLEKKLTLTRISE